MAWMCVSLGFVKAQSVTIEVILRKCSRQYSASLHPNNVWTRFKGTDLSSPPSGVVDEVPTRICLRLSEWRRVRGGACVAAAVAAVCVCVYVCVCLVSLLCLFRV